jgi:lysophospholipid acyltransferase (LPLAT)-like uncharacterized protein
MKIWLNRVSLYLVPAIIWTYLKFTAFTSKIIIDGSEYPNRLKQDGTGFIFAFWHSRQIILPLVRQDDEIHCLISSSRDGEYVSRVANLFGKKTVRGSSTRGGYEAMKEMMNILRSGGIVAITPDGPLGPAEVVKPGVVQMSRAIGCPIIPIAFDASSKKVFKSWDRFYLPYPCSKIAITFGEPCLIDTADSIEVARDKLKTALDATTSRAAELVSNQT